MKVSELIALIERIDPDSEVTVNDAPVSCIRWAEGGWISLDEELVSLEEYSPSDWLLWRKT